MERITPYSKEEVLKLQQFEKDTDLAKFLFPRRYHLKEGYKYALIDQQEGVTTVYDDEAYQTIMRRMGNTFDELLDLGLNRIVKEVVERPTTIAEIKKPTEQTA